MNYNKLYKESIDNPTKFWKQYAKNIAWFKEPKQILTPTDDWNNWFEDGELNMAYLCIDKHILDGYGEQTALVYDSPVTNTVLKVTYLQLSEEVGKLASGLTSLGLTKGDTAIIYMPMIPQAVYAMLACARIGVIHSVVFGGFAAHELAIRINDCKPKVLITASNGIEIDRIIPYKPLVDKAIEEAHFKPNNVVHYDRKMGVDFKQNNRDIDYMLLVNNFNVSAPVSVKSTDPLYILYTSGTTGTPKGIIRDTGGYATALLFSMKHIYGVNPGDVFWAASDVGWVVGHSYIVYAPLLNRNTTILFEGKPIRTPDASTFWRVISDHKVNVMFTAPTAIRAIRKEDPDGKLIRQHDISSLKYQFLAGERCDMSTLNWTKQKIGVPVIDHWWQTESGWPMVANMVGIGLLPVKEGSVAKPVCGYNLQILNEDGTLAEPNKEGLVAIKLPLPPGNLVNLWENPARFKASYLSHFTGYYFSGDGGYMDEDGYVFITGRVDDIINVAGHRLSTAEMEEVVSSHPAVAECAVFGVHCDIKGQKPLGLIVLKSGVEINEAQIETEIITKVRNEIGPVASFKEVKIVQRLPKTRSGKILRELLRKLFDNEVYTIPSTIDDINIISELKIVFKNKI